MVGTIGPLVKVARGTWLVATLAFVGASTAAGLALFSSVAEVRHLLGWSPRSALPLLIALLLAAALADLNPAFQRAPSLGTRVPRSWWERFGATVGATFYGAVLGLGVTTIVPYAGFYALLGSSFFLDVSGAAFVGATFGLARALPVVLASVAIAVGVDPAVVGDETSRIDRRIVRKSSATILIAIAVGLVATAVDGASG